MPSTIVDTPGDAGANSYIDLTFANTYAANRPNHATWDAGTDAQKEEAILWAAQLIDMAFDWTGAAADPATQALAWPRIGMLNKNNYPIATSAIPAELKNAQAEYARNLLAGDLAADNDAVKNELLGLKAGSVSLQFRNTEAGMSVEEMDAAVRRKGPDLNYLAKWVPDAVRLLIPRSWYEQNQVSNPMVFIAGGGGFGRY